MNDIASVDTDDVGAFLDSLADSLQLVTYGTVLGSTDPSRRMEIDAAAEEAEQLAAEMSALPPEALPVIASAELPPVGLVAVLQRLPAASRGALVSALAEPMPDDPRYGLDLCRAALEQSARFADDTEQVMDPTSLPSGLMAAMTGSGQTAAYASEIASAAPADLTELVASLSVHAVPSVLSELVATVYDALELRFGQGVALAAARGQLLLRIIGATLSPDLAADLEKLLTGEDTHLAALDEAFTAFTENVIDAGREAALTAAAGEDPDDIVLQRGSALQSAEHLAATFNEPTPEDPLGTLPANPTTVLGQAILRARRRRPGGYAWERVATLRDQDPLMFLALLHDERVEVMDLIEIPGGFLDADAN